MAEPTPLLKPVAPAQSPARLWTHDQFVFDHWRRLDDAAPVERASRPLLSLARWRREGAALRQRGQRIGLALETGETLDRSSDDPSGLAVIALVLGKFTDGRVYSTARHLREDWGYAGEIRATGDVLLDQIPLMLRAGIDAFEITDAATIRALERGHLPAVSRVYQRGVDAVPRPWRERRAGEFAAASADPTRSGHAHEAHERA